MDRRVAVAELARLDRAARRVVGRVEVDDRPAAALVGEVVDRPGLIGQGDARERRRRPQACSWSERSRGFDDEQATAPELTPAAGARRTFDSPRAPPGGSGSSASGYAQPVGRHALHAAAHRQQRDDVAVAPRQPAPDRGAVRAGRGDLSVTRERPSSSTAVRPASAGMASRPTFARAWSMRGPPSAPTTTIPCRSQPQRRDGRPARCRTRPCPAGSVRRGRRPPRGLRARPRRSESPSPTHRSMATPRPVASRAPPSAATTSPTAASQPGHVASSASRVGAVAVGQDQGVHRPRCYPARTRRPRPDARLRPVPDAPLHPAIQRVIDAAARKGVTIEVTVFDESTHTAVEAAAAVGVGARPDRQVAGVRDPDRRTASSPLLCLVAGHNRVDVARLAAVTERAPTSGARPLARRAT